MARKVGKGSKRPRSLAKAHAQKTPQVKMRLRAKRDYIIDDRPSQQIAKRSVSASKTLTKNKFETVTGTRIQCVAGGKPVRVIEQDGKQFDPQNVRGARKYLAKLAVENEELARIRGMQVVAVKAGKNCKRPLTPAPARHEREPQTKKARKALAADERRQKIAKLHSEEVAKEQRQLVSDRWFTGTVVGRTTGQALVQLSASHPLNIAEDDLVQLRKRSNELAAAALLSSGEGDKELVLSLRFGDAEAGLDLKQDVKLTFKIFRAASGVVGACEAEAIEPKLCEDAATCDAPAIETKTCEEATEVPDAIPNPPAEQSV